VAQLTRVPTDSLKDFAICYDGRSHSVSDADVDEIFGADSCADLHLTVGVNLGVAFQPDRQLQQRLQLIPQVGAT
jgi:hypothetical protein